MSRCRAVAFGTTLALIFALTHPALADTFTTYVVATSSGSIDNYGLTSGGTLVLSEASFHDYVTFTPPSTYVTTQMPPALTFDNGVSCTPTNTGAYSYVANGVCNNGFEVFDAEIGSSLVEGLYDGPDPIANLVARPHFGGYINILLNSRGDVATTETNTVAGDDSLLILRGVTPEPSSIALPGDGVVGGGG